MNVFLSWSGERSKAVAELLDDWVQCVIQAVDPWMSSKDIDRGSLWFSEINDQLQNTSIGIICLTQENKNKPWILFEAGALAKGISTNRVCAFLIDLKPEEVGTPLSQFNHTFPNQEGLWELVRTLNSSLKERALKEKILEQVFDTYWPKFEESFKQILKDYPITGEVEKRSDDDILLEILSTTRGMDRRIRALESDRTNMSASESFKKKIRNSMAIKKQITMHLEHGLPPEIVREIIVKETGAPLSFIDSTINEFIGTDD